MNQVEKFINMISSDQLVAFDTETNGLHKFKTFICGYGCSDGKDVAYVPVRHGEGGGTQNGNIENVEQFENTIKPILKNRRVPLVLQNCKFDMHMCANHNIELPDIIDTMTNGCLIDENQWSFSLANLCKKYPDIPQKKGTELYKYIADQFGCKPTVEAMGHFWKLLGDDPIGTDYANYDNISTFALNEAQTVELYEQQLDSLAKLEHKLSKVLFKMERKGIKVDLEEAESVKNIINELHLKAYENIPLTEDFEPINVKSQKDLQKYFEWCGIDDWPMTPPTERFPNGSPSFNKNFLGTHQQGFIILEARKYDHLKSSFIDPLPNHIHNGRIHTSFNQTAGEFGGTKTGRLSSVGPNMQQIPKRDKFTGKIFRKMFVPDEDFIFVEFDYSQAEPRLFTHYSKEPALMRGYSQTPNIDMHDVASQYMGLDNKLGKEEGRKVAKNLNLGMMYAMGYNSLADHLNVELNEAKEMSYRWHRTFPKVSSFTKQASKVAEQRGFVRTILGRRARFPDPRFSYRTANRIVQGGISDILKYKMVELDDWLSFENLHDVCQMLLNIHDAILFQIHKDYLHLINDIDRIMCDLSGPPFNLTVPFRTDYHKGANWSEASYA